VSEVLVWALDDPANNPLRYRKGDIVRVEADGYNWGNREGLPNFWQITVTSLVDTDRTPLIETVNEPALLIPFLIKRRKRFLDITLLSNFAQNNLANTGKATVLRLAFLNALTLRP
jgi:hypothetical protein